MNTFITILLYNILLGFCSSIIEFLLFKPITDIYIKKIILFIFIYINYFTLSILLTIIFFIIYIIISKFPKSIILKIKLNNFWYNHYLKTSFFIRFAIIVIIAIIFASLLFFLNIGTIKEIEGDINQHIQYVFFISSFIFFVSIIIYRIDNKLKYFLKKHSKKITYKLYLFFLILYIITTLSTIIITGIIAYGYKIFYIEVGAVLILLNLFFILIVMVYNSNRYIFHKIGVVTIFITLFIAMFSLFNRKNINLKPVLFVLSKENFLSEKLNSKILEAFFDKDLDGFYSFISYGDCNDNDPLINPLAYDIPDNNIDENCNGFDEKSFISFNVSHSQPIHRSIKLNYIPKILLVTLENFEYGDRDSFINLWKYRSNSLVFRHTILPTTKNNKNINDLINLKPNSNITTITKNILYINSIPKKIENKKLYILNLDMKKYNIKDIDHIYKKGIKNGFTEIFIIPTSIMGSGLIGYYGLDNSLFMDQIDSFTIIWSKYREYKRGKYHSYISGFDIFSTIYELLSINKKLPIYTRPLLSELLFNTNHVISDHPIYSYRLNSFNKIIEKSIILNEKQCIYSNRAYKLDCFSTSLPLKNIKISDNFKKIIKKGLNKFSTILK